MNNSKNRKSKGCDKLECNDKTSTFVQYFYKITGHPSNDNDSTNAMNVTDYIGSKIERLPKG
jgi:hypothetical protein